MSDPFQDVDSAGIEFAETTAKTMEIRQSEPVMEKIVKDYLESGYGPLIPTIFGRSTLCTISLAMGAAIKC